MTRNLNMKKPFRQCMLTAAFCAISGLSVAAPASDDSITIYSRMQPGAVSPAYYRPTGGRNTGNNIPGYGIVRHDRVFDIPNGTSTLRVTDVAALIDPTTVTFSSLDEPKTKVLEQSFQFDLVSQAKLLQRYLGEKIAIEQVRGNEVDVVEGTLLGIGDGLTLLMDDGSVQAIRSYGNLRFSQLPGGLITRPTLEWLIDSPRGGSQNTRITYETQGMTWWADYNILLDESDGCSMNLAAWVSIINQSGSSFENTRLKLIAGDVNRARPPEVRREAVYKMALAEESADFAEKAFFEYHMYTLGRRTDLPDQSTRQLQLFPSTDGVKCQKEMVFSPTLNTPYFGSHQIDQGYGREGRGDIAVFLRFRNDEKSGLGIPMPAGRIRVNQEDSSDGSLEFIGEDVLEHTPRNEDILVEMGNAFDVVGERKQVDFRIDTRTRNLWESFEITLRNHKESAVDIVVLENLYRAANWEIVDPSRKFSKENSNRIRFDASIPAEAETVIRYTVHYTW
jgi:hypothetical protein